MALVWGLTACTGVVTGGPGGATGGDDDTTPLPGDDAGTPPVPGQPDAAPTDPPPTNDPDPLATGIQIAKVSILQSVQIPLVASGAAVTPRNATVVEGRDSLFTITYSVDSGFTPRRLEARVDIDGSSYKAQADVSASSGDAPTAALQIKVPGTAIKTTSRFAVSLHEVAGASPPAGASSGARYPASGTAPLDAKSVNGPLHLVLVPFRYQADGSGRLPPTDDTSVAARRDAFRAMYPVADVVVTVHAPVDTNITIQSSDSWSQWLDELDAVRQADNPPDNTYYYGMAAPASSFGNFCNGGCIVGLGHVTGANNSFLFGAVGVSFSGSLLADTALHEIGHTMGRQHVDCGGPSGIDPSYPYGGGAVGVWGYDALGDQLKDPTVFTDIMGYCNKQWISDYEYEAIFQRLSRVNSQSFAKLSTPLTYRVGLVDAAGKVTWRRLATLTTLPDGQVRRVSLRDAQGVDLGSVDGHFFAYDHAPGGTIYVPLDGLMDPAAIAPGGAL